MHRDVQSPRAANEIEDHRSCPSPSATRGFQYIACLLYRRRDTAASGIRDKLSEEAPYRRRGNRRAGIGAPLHHPQTSYHPDPPVGLPKTSTSAVCPGPSLAMDYKFWHTLLSHPWWTSTVDAIPLLYKNWDRLSLLRGRWSQPRSPTSYQNVSFIPNWMFRPPSPPSPWVTVSAPALPL